MKILKFSILKFSIFIILFYKVNSQTCPTTYSLLYDQNVNPFCHNGPTTIFTSLCAVGGNPSSGVVGAFGNCPSTYASLSTGEATNLSGQFNYNSCSTKVNPIVYYGQFGGNCGPNGDILTKQSFRFNQTFRYFVFSTCNSVLKSVVGELSSIPSYSLQTQALCEVGGGQIVSSSYFDYGIIICPNGYNGYPNCSDINECLTGEAACTQGCTNTKGGFYCYCNSGYRLDTDKKTCTDINECDELSSGCSQRCSNTNGGFTCYCNFGYILNSDNKTCDDINECLDGNSGCSQGCTNTVGSFTCSCDHGYTLNADGKTCDDINECLTNSCGIDDKIICTNQLGSFICTCTTGYLYSSYFQSCQDIDECATSNGGCSDICENNQGSYNCKCPTGYLLSPIDNKTCEDIDECSTIPNICNATTSSTLICINNKGSYSCAQVHSISSVTPSTTKGGSANFTGKFGNIHQNISLSIGVLGNCEIINITSSLIHCIAPPGVGTHSVNFTQNGLSFIGNKIYNYKLEVKECLNDCTSNGQCNTETGECKCNVGYSDFDCSINIENQPPKTNITIDSNTGGSTLNNQQTNFAIYIKSLTELDFNGQPVKTYHLKNNWSLNHTDSNIYSFNQFLNSGNDSQGDQQQCEIKSIVEEVISDRDYTFADTTFTVKSGLVKFSIIISNYTYQSYLNTLRLDLISSASDNEKDECNLKETEIDTSKINDKSYFNYIRISKNNKILSGRFINKLVSDGRSTYYSTSSVINNTDSSVIVSLYLPHFTNDLIIDPDFSVLVSPNFKSSCESSRKKWLIPVVVVVPVVVVSILTVVTIIMVKRKQVEIKVGIAKLKNINK